MKPRVASSAATSVVARDGRTMARPRHRPEGGPGCGQRVRSWTRVVTLNGDLRGDAARFEVSSDLALDALQRVVDRLSVAIEPAGDRLVRVAVEVERQHRALEL